MTTFPAAARDEDVAAVEVAMASVLVSEYSAAAAAAATAAAAGAIGALFLGGAEDTRPVLVAWAERLVSTSIG